ncbi:MAG: DUF975 family protein, partial [Bacteroidota bacterium]
AIPIPGTTFNPFGEQGVLTQQVNFSPISTLVSGAFAIGICYYHLIIAKNQEPRLEDIFKGFEQFIQSLVAAILMGLIIVVGLVFFIVPGIIAALGLSQTYYIMADNPGIDAIEAMKQSWEMTKGYKGQLFLLGLSFLPWAILSIFTLFIGLLWLMPYMYVSFSHFYLQLRGEEQELDIEDHLVF